MAFMLAHQALITATFRGNDGDASNVRTAKFATSDGGSRSTEISDPIRPGGMDEGVRLAGLSSTDEISFTKPFDPVADPPLIEWLEANSGCDLDYKEQPLGRNKLPVGTAKTRQAVLGTITRPNFDADSNDKVVWGVTVGPQVTS